MNWLGFLQQLTPLEIEELRSAMDKVINTRRKDEAKKVLQQLESFEVQIIKDLANLQGINIGDKVIRIQDELLTLLHKDVDVGTVIALILEIQENK